jgi:spore maturation protein CgeB
MKILFTGPFRPESTTLARKQGFINLGYEATFLDQVPYIESLSFFLGKVQLHAHIGPYVTKYNRDLTELAYQVKPDVIFVEIGSYLWRSTVKKLKSQCKTLVHYTSEYFGYKTYWYRNYFKSIELYDTHIITNPLNETGLYKKGAKKIIMDEFGFNPNLHRPIELTSEEKEQYRSNAIFIGHWEPSTQKGISILRKNGIDAKVWGGGWNWRAFGLKDRSKIQRIGTEEYVKAISATKIGLCFLSKKNRNLCAGRIFEIPAIGQFLLAERTEDTQRYFEEGKEAEFFSSPEELVEKAKYYLENEEERLKIAKAGLQRCLNSRYTLQNRLEDMMEKIL